MFSVFHFICLVFFCLFFLFLFLFNKCIYKMLQHTTTSFKCHTKRIDAIKGEKNKINRSVRRNEQRTLLLKIQICQQKKNVRTLFNSKIRLTCSDKNLPKFFKTKNRMIFSTARNCLDFFFLTSLWKKIYDGKKITLVIPIKTNLDVCGLYEMTGFIKQNLTIN